MGTPDRTTTARDQGRRSGWAAGLLGLALLLGGCASVIRLDHEVQSYPRWSAGAVPGPGDRFGFERLPSLAQATAEQTALEAAVGRRLQATGLQPASDAAPARWLIEVSARSQKFPYAPWDDPRERWPFGGLVGRDYVVTGNGKVVRMPGFAGMTPPYYQREVSVLVRDARNGQAVYESRAAHDGRWHGTPAIWEALVQAALDGFPQAPSGPRRVTLDVPR